MARDPQALKRNAENFLPGTERNLKCEKAKFRTCIRVYTFCSALHAARVQGVRAGGNNYLIGRPMSLNLLSCSHTRISRKCTLRGARSDRPTNYLGSNGKTKSP